MVIISTAYAVFTLQLAITVISTCSFMLKGPGLKKRDLGMTFSINLPIGKLINWITSGETTIAFWRNQKNWLTKANAQQKIIERNHMRKVFTGNVGSSVLSMNKPYSVSSCYMLVRKFQYTYFGTTSRTSSIGESSSSSLCAWIGSTS